MEIEKLSSQYHIRRLGEEDTEEIVTLCSGNTLFYRWHPPRATKESIWQDMHALPPGKAYADKFYIGFYQDEKLLAMMDLIAGYPTEQTAYIGLFMVAKPCQGKGVGSGIIRDCARALSEQGFQKICLAIDRGNPQSEAFWRKNHFCPTDEKAPGADARYIPMERKL